MLQHLWQAVSVSICLPSLAGSEDMVSCVGLCGTWTRGMCVLSSWRLSKEPNLGMTHDSLLIVSDRHLLAVYTAYMAV